MNVVLSSQSPRRHRLVSTLGFPFRCMHPRVDELSGGMSPRDLVLENALRKWRWCCEREPDALILAADTAVEIDGEVLGKPRNRAEAEGMLQRESGRLQAVHTGYVLACEGEGDPPGTCGVETSWVMFKRLSVDDIHDYLDRVQPYDRAGAYDIDESGDLLIASYKGSRTNIMGLPLERIQELLSCRH